MPRFPFYPLLHASFLILCMTALVCPAFAEDNVPLRRPSGGWPHQGLFGVYDRIALKRGFRIYHDICSSCHSMKLLSYRDLEQIGFAGAEVKVLAAEAKVVDEPNDQGDMGTRPGRPSDTFALPFPNDQAARQANNGALPPDLSLIIKARAGHENYVYSLLTGYGPPPAGEKIPEGMYYNPYFPGHQISMLQPLTDGILTYTDGTPATVEQMAKDVVQFLAWAAEPNLEERHRTGVKVLLFLIVFAVLMYLVKRKIWEKLG
jgi:ubiquinol-cytochrome c reductase cytochrome c1 subunit